MIKKVLIITVGFLAFYFFLLETLRPDWKPQRSLWQENVVLGEDYIYENRSKKVVFVGTSLGFNMKNEYLPENTYNLSLTGLSLFSGLEIIKKSDGNPELIFIEINHFERYADHRLSEKIFSPYSFYSKKVFNFLREKNNSYSLYIGPLIGRVGKFILTGGKGRVNDNSPKKINQEVYNIELKAAIEEFGKTKEDSVWLVNIELLKKYEDYFKKKNCRIVFFEAPMDKRVSNSPMLLKTKKILQTYFPVNQYLYLRDDKLENYATTDGKHLDEPSSIKFADFLIQNMSLAAKPLIAIPDIKEQE